MSKEVQMLLGSMVFWSGKRPITVELLKRVNLQKVAEHLGIGHEYMRHASKGLTRSNQMMLAFGSAAE